MIYRKYIILLFLHVVLAAMAQSPSAVAAPDADDAQVEEDADIDDSQSEIRENPDMQDNALLGELPFHQSTDYSLYPFLKLRANKINLNGANWDRLVEMFGNAADTVVSIVHIGDSHIQAEGATTRTRMLLQNHFGSAGRGLIIPFRLAGTNQPLDYAITSESDFTIARAMKQPWPEEMGFTGISLTPKRSKFDFTIAVKPVDGVEQDFDVVRIFFHGKIPSIESIAVDGYAYTLFTEAVSGDTLTVYLTEPAIEAKFEFESKGRCQVYGFELQNSMTGVEYSAIGNNGATYATYNNIGTVGRELKALSPNLVILSMGANEAFGKVSDAAMYDNIDMLVRDIQRHNPDAQILIVTPSECQRASYVKRKGRKRRVKSYAVNDNVKRLRNVMLKYGEENHIATYDWYEVAGGDGSSDKWIKEELMKSDRIHNTWGGYALQGHLLFDALFEIVK